MVKRLVVVILVMLARMFRKFVLSGPIIHPSGAYVKMVVRANRQAGRGGMMAQSRLVGVSWTATGGLTQGLRQIALDNKTAPGE